MNKANKREVGYEDSRNDLWLQYLVGQDLRTARHIKVFSSTDPEFTPFGLLKEWDILNRTQARRRLTSKRIQTIHNQSQYPDPTELFRFGNSAQTGDLLSSDLWAPAVYQHEIRAELIAEAPPQQYRHLPASGSDELDVTSYYEPHKNWGLESRDDRPDVCFDWNASTTVSWRSNRAQNSTSLSAPLGSAVAASWFGPRLTSIDAEYRKLYEDDRRSKRMLTCLEEIQHVITMLQNVLEMLEDGLKFLRTTFMSIAAVDTTSAPSTAEDQFTPSLPVPGATAPTLQQISIRPAPGRCVTRAAARHLQAATPAPDDPEPSAGDSESTRLSTPTSSES
ncbi:MAG: hypothetical protein Q9171_004585 [Xanthocarpia ochracea]